LEGNLNWSEWICSQLQIADANGFYSIPFIHKSKPTVFQLWMITPSGIHDDRNVFLKTKSAAVENFSVDDQ
jgi:hypothetical protein